MAPRQNGRLIVLIVLAVLTAASAFYALTALTDPAPPRTDPCPPERPVRLEAGPCVPVSYLETTAHRGGGER